MPKEQAWENCKYAWDPINARTNKYPYGCTHSQIMKIYPVIKVNGNPETDWLPDNDSTSFANLYRQKLFHQNTNFLRKILELTLREGDLTNLLVELEMGKINLPHINEEEIIKRALAGCIHCRFHEFM